MKKDWTDQPAEIAATIGMATISTRGHSVVVYRGPDAIGPYGAWRNYYITIGNLFGSQTVEVPSADHALTMLGMISDALAEERRPPQKLPPWATLLPNVEGGA